MSCARLSLTYVQFSTPFGLLQVQYQLPGAACQTGCALLSQITHRLAFDRYFVSCVLHELPTSNGERSHHPHSPLVP